MSVRDDLRGGVNPRLSLRLFGHVEIDADGVPFRLATPRKTLSLLTYLALHRTSGLERDFIAYTFWPDDEEDGARQRLRANLHDLGRVLPPRTGGWFDAGKDNIAWNEGVTIEVDVERFEALARDPSTFRVAVELYRGDLATALYDDWIDEPRERLRSLYLTILDQLSSDARRDRDFPLAISSARRILAIDPWREDILRRLLSSRYESGDATGALAEFTEFTNRLRSEIGTDPMPETIALRDRVLRNAEIETEPLGQRRTTPARDGLADALPFIGRGSETAKLEAAWKAATLGRGGFAIVGGEAGIGKSRLVLDFAARVAENGGRVLIGATARPESTPYQPFVEALRSALPLLASLPLEPLTAATLAALVPELRGRNELPELPALDGERERIRTFAAVARALALLAKPRPLLIVLEDLHFAAETTLGLLEFTLRQTAGSRVLFVATMRDAEGASTLSLERARREVSARGAATEIFLRPLAAAEASKLVATRVRDAATATALCERAEGHPLYLVQLMDAAVEGAFDATATLEGLLAARTAQLSPEARTAGEIAATIGRVFPSSMVGPVAGWSEADARLAIDELVSRRLLREVPGRGLFDMAFAHQLLADAFSANVRPERMRDRHRRIASNFERLFPGDRSELEPSIARHYDLAGDAEKASTRFLSAGRRAMALGAVDEAKGMFRRAADLAVADDLRIEALLDLEAAHSSLGDTDGRIPALAELELAVARVDDPNLTFVAAERAWVHASHVIDEAGQRRALEAMRESARRLQSAHLAAKAELHEITTSAMAVVPTTELVDSARDLAASFARLDDPDLQARALSIAAALATRMMHRSDALALIGQAVSVVEAVKSAPRHAVFVYNRACYVGMRVGDAALVDRATDRWAELARTSGDRLETVKSLSVSCWTYASDGRIGIAIARLREAYDFYVAHGIAESIAVQRTNLATAFAHIGAVEETIACVMTPEAPWQPTQSRRTSLLSLSYAASGRGDRAVEIAQSGVEAARESADLYDLIDYIERFAMAQIARGAYADALAYVDEAFALIERTGGARRRVTGLSLRAWSLAHVGDLAGAREAVDEMLADEPYHFDITEWPERCDWIAAVVLRAAGETDRAATLLARARAHTIREADTLEPAHREIHDAIPWHREILAAAERDEWPELG